MVISLGWEDSPVEVNGCCSLFSCQLMSDSSQPYGLQHTRLPCPSNSCPLVLTMSSTHLIFCCLLLLPSISPSIRIFYFFTASGFFTSGTRASKYQSFSISPSSEYSGLLSFRIDWFDLHALQGTLTVLYTSKLRARLLSHLLFSHLHG